MNQIETSKFFIQPTWPAPSSIKAYTSLRASGISRPPENRLDRAQLVSYFNLPNEPIWLRQTHSDIVLPAIVENREKEADASYSDQPNQVCIIQTADCLPILLCHKEGKQVAAIHAGWRGLAKNIISKTLAALNYTSNNFLAWIGPSISQIHYEVGDEVREVFIEMDARNQQAFIPSTNQRWLADLPFIATLQLKKAGVNDIYGGDICTYTNEKQFFSYRREGAGTGRIVSLIWL
ncbi:MAG: peptidoglycan editing factor PgeF [Gammaproteobacteria bacterium]|nr:peptidoglycan editing factor PgeF [Gammaproteobacteria bacterium]